MHTSDLCKAKTQTLMPPDIVLSKRKQVPCTKPATNEAYGVAIVFWVVLIPILTSGLPQLQACIPVSSPNPDLKTYAIVWNPPSAGNSTVPPPADSMQRWVEELAVTKWHGKSYMYSPVVLFIGTANRFLVEIGARDQGVDIR